MFEGHDGIGTLNLSSLKVYQCFIMIVINILLYKVGVSDLVSDAIKVFNNHI